jgi:phosphatidylethanolamine/phosphatidyl-N-methylethanolamine N-methyltransferase
MVRTSSNKLYDNFSPVYPVIDLFLKPQKQKFFRRIDGYPHGRLLEIGVGNGAHFKYYNTHDITGVDTSASMLARAQKHRKDNIQLLHMDGQTLAFPNGAFDYVVLSHVIAVVDDPEILLREIYRVLKPGGKVFILNHFTPDNWLKYVDKVFAVFSKLFYFKSVFYRSDIRELEKFTLLHEWNAGMFSYFKILVYEKNDL